MAKRRFAFLEKPAARPEELPELRQSTGASTDETFAPAQPPARLRPWKGPALLALAAAALTGVAVMVSKEKTAGTYEQAREKDKASAPQLFTDFKARVNDVRRIAMRFKGQDFVIERTPDGGWIMPDRHRYPVDVEKVRGVLLNAAELEVLERKTNDPEKLKSLGLDDPEKKESDAVRVQFFDERGAALTSFVAGKRRLNGGYALYVRKEAETQAYLVKGEGWLRLDPGPDYWLNVERFRLNKDAVKSAAFRHSKTPADDVTLDREHAGARKFRLETLIPAGMEEDEAKVNEAAFGLGETLSLRGVFPDTGGALEGEDPVTATYTLFSGLVVTVETAKDKEGDYPARFRAKAPDGATAEVKKAAEAYNKAASGWLYLLSDESAKLIAAGPGAVTRKPEPKKEGGQAGSPVPAAADATEGLPSAPAPVPLEAKEEGAKVPASSPAKAEGASSPAKAEGVSSSVKEESVPSPAKAESVSSSVKEESVPSPAKAEGSSPAKEEGISVPASSPAKAEGSSAVPSVKGSDGADHALPAPLRGPTEVINPFAAREASGEERTGADKQSGYAPGAFGPARGAEGGDPHAQTK